MTRAETQERSLKIYEELSKGRHVYRVSEKYGLTEQRVRQIKRDMELKIEKENWVNYIIYPKVKMWFKRNVNGLELMKKAGIRQDKVMAFLQDDTRTLSVKTINTILDVLDMSFEEAFYRKQL